MAETQGRGGFTVAGALDQELLARGLNAEDLERLTGISGKTIRRARSGRGKVSRDTLVRIVDALSKVPVRPMAGRLVGVTVITDKRIAAVGKAAAMKEVSGGRRRASG